MDVLDTPVGVDDPVNAAILKISEDRIAGFQRDPLGAIGAASGVDVETVIARIGAMLRAGTIRRVRQTLLATNLAHGALVAWQIAPERLDDAFDFMFGEDPFSGHVVIRTADPATPGSNYRLWTTLKVPQGYSLEKHAEFLRNRVGATTFRLMPAKRLFVLGVGHIRRPRVEGARCAEARVRPPRIGSRSLARARGGGRRRARRVLSRRRVVADRRRDRTLLDVPRTRQADCRQSACDTLQRALSLARCARPRARRGGRGRPALHHDARLLARRRPRVSQRH